MKIYVVTAESRLDVKKRLEQLTGIRAEYTRMPECAFLIGDYKLEKRGTLLVPDEADMGPIDQLVEEGMIASNDTVPEDGAGENMTEEGMADMTEETTAEETVTEETAAEETTAEETTADENFEEIIISMPRANHTITTLRNLINMICSRGALISKATGGEFSCPSDLAEELAIAMTPETFWTILNSRREDLKGLEITEETISFTGFPGGVDPEHVHAFTVLASFMNTLALKSNRVLARPVNDENEKYIFRVWLIRLGMAGPEYSEVRRLLLEPLSGNTAFRDQDMKDRWQEKHMMR